MESARTWDHEASNCQMVVDERVSKVVVTLVGTGKSAGLCMWVDGRGTDPEV